MAALPYVTLTAEPGVIYSQRGEVESHKVQPILEALSGLDRGLTGPGDALKVHAANKEAGELIDHAKEVLFLNGTITMTQKRPQDSNIERAGMTVDTELTRSETGHTEASLWELHAATASGLADNSKPGESTVSHEALDLEERQVVLIEYPAAGLSLNESPDPTRTPGEQTIPRHVELKNEKVDLKNIYGNIDQDSPRTAPPSVTKDMERKSAPSSLTSYAKAPVIEDTELLKDFLSRAQAKKAAKAAPSPVRDSSPNKEQAKRASPTTRSRSALVPMHCNSTSPRKTQETSGQTRGLSKADKEMVNIDAEAGISSSCRRSRRNPLAKPQKAVPSLPNTIPLRRADGTEFIFLQRGEAHELAMATRSNTKRNKGDSVLPKFMLTSLTEQTGGAKPSPSIKRKRLKKVSWDERLAYFEEQEQQSEREEGGEKVSTAKRVRRPQQTNGTPAPEKAMRATAVQFTPVPKRRGKIR